MPGMFFWPIAFVGRPGNFSTACPWIERTKPGERTVLGGDDEPARAADALVDGLEVRRHERAQIDHLGVDAVVRERFRSAMHVHDRASPATRL